MTEVNKTSFGWLIIDKDNNYVHGCPKQTYQELTTAKIF